MSSDAQEASDAIAALSRAGVALANFSLGQPRLDEVFGDSVRYALASTVAVLVGFERARGP